MSLRTDIEYSGFEAARGSSKGSSPAHVSYIKKTIFKIASPERILQNSVAEIYNHLATPYDKQDGHLFDRKMGAKDRTGENSLSKLDYTWDPGHFGHIRLAKPVFQIPYYTMIVQVLNMVCHRCSSFLISPNDNDGMTMKQIRARKGKARFAFVQPFFKADKIKNCWNCGACTIKCSKDTKDGTPKVAIKKGGVRSRSIRNDYPQTILALAETCKKQAEDPKAAIANAAAAAGFAAEESEDPLAAAIAEEQAAIAEEETEAVNDSGKGKGKGKRGNIGEREKLDFIDAEVAHTILKKITNEDVELMGLSAESSRPDWMIWTVMPVPPPSMRPAVTNESGQTADDDLTHKLNEIIKTNNQMRNILSSEQTAEEKKHLYNWWQLLQYHVATYIDNDIKSNIPPAINRSGRAYKTLRQRVNHKEGRIRGNLMGKRANRTARSVITPDPNISIDELGVPYDIAMTLTKDEIVNNYNIKRLTQLVRNGPVWPGALGYDARSKSSFETSTGEARNGFRKSLQHMSKEKRAEIVLNVGDVVYRHILDGDVVLFNRQPSLHKMSMMGHRAKILPGKTFRLNPQVCTPYNADFDGDEMNMHVPNSLQASTEVREIALVPTQIVSPQASRPIMGLIQDALLASYRFTKIRPEAHLNTMQVMTLLGVTSGYAGKLPPPTQVSADGRHMLWDTKSIISTFLPKINYRLDRGEGKKKAEPAAATSVATSTTSTTAANKENAAANAQVQRDAKIKEQCILPVAAGAKDTSTVKASDILEIENGQMKTGYFDKDTFGSRENSLIHVTWNDWGPEATRNLFDDMNKMAMKWLIMDGFSVGIGDMTIAKSDYDEIQHQIHEKVIEAQTKIEFLHQGRYPIVKPEDKKDFHKIMVTKLGYWIGSDTIHFSDTGKPIMEQFEADMYVVLNDARKAAEENTSKKILPSNRMASMINSGSKGSKTNTVQIIVLLGQQDMDGGRIPNGYQRRPLPHFNKDTLVPEAHGFIDKGYLLGLSPPQYFFHAMSGRVGIISTSIKTAETGYLQRRLMKALEDLGVRYDWTVRNANDLIFQFYYGMDGFDGSKLEVQKLDYVSLSDDDFRLRYQFQPNELANLSELLTPNIVSDISSNTKLFDEALTLEFNTLRMDRDLLRKNFFRDPTRLPDKFYVPVNFTRLIESYRSRFNIRNRKLADLNPSHVVSEVDRLIREITNEYQIPGKSGTPISADPEDLLIIKALLRSYLSSKKLVKLGFTKDAFDTMIVDINRKFQEAYVAPGEMVGAIAAQSIGEPSTQMTLNSVDYATPMAIVWKSKNRLPPAPVDGPVGAFIDALMKERALKVQVQADGVTEYLPLGDDEAMALSCDAAGNKRWTPLEAVTRHPVVNKDGSSTLLRVRLDSGRTVEVTRGKSMLVARDGRIEACNGDELKLGDCVPVIRSSKRGKDSEKLYSIDLRTIMPTSELAEFADLVKTETGFGVSMPLDWSLGFLIGEHLTDLPINDNYSAFYRKVVIVLCGENKNKRVPSLALSASDDFIDGLFSGYFGKTIQNPCPRTFYNASLSKAVRDVLATLLQMRIGVHTTLHEYKQLSNDHHVDTIYGFNITNLEEKRYDVLKDHYLEKIVAFESVEPTAVHKRVYDLTVAETRNMTTMSGVALADTFHLAGVGEKANVSRGVPRIKEILRVTNVLATPTVTVSIKREALLKPIKTGIGIRQLPAATIATIADKDINKPGDNETVYDRERRLREEEEKKTAHMNAEDLASQIEYTTLRDLISAVTIIYDPNNDSENIEAQAGTEFLSSYKEFMGGLRDVLDSQEFPWIIKVEFKKDVISQKNITIDDIKYALSELQQLNTKGDQRLEFPATDANSSFTDSAGDPAYVIRLTVKNAVANESPSNLIRYFEKILLDIRVKGIQGIETARVRFIKDYPYYDPIDGAIKKTFNYEIDTNGVNMLDIWNMKDIDPERTYSNHIIEIYETLGISAVREAIVNELNEVFLYAGASINPRHVELLADMMTSRGYLISVDRHGMSKGDSGPWARASFEETTAQIFKAAMYGEVDPMTGVSANIMTGQFIPAGTNSFRVGLDEVALETLKPFQPPSLTDKATSALAASLGKGTEAAGTSAKGKETTVAGFCQKEPEKAFMYDFM